MDYKKLVNIYLGYEPSINDVGFICRDGKNVEIEYWNIIDKSQPTIEELEALQIEVEKQDNNNIIKQQILELETKQQRALREFILGIDGSEDRLRNIDNEIINLRNKLL